MMNAKFRAAPLLGERVGAEVKPGLWPKADQQFDPGHRRSKDEPFFWEVESAAVT
jgi:hypothetical protein